MKTIRYYYSPDYRVVNADALVYKDVSIELLEKKGKTKFLPRITVCGIYDHDTNELSIGVSRCSSKDQFRKSVGREISMDRAKNNPYTIIKVDKDVHKIFIGICMSLEETLMNKF